MLLLAGGALLIGAFLFKDQIMGALGSAGLGGQAMKDCVKQRCQKCLQPGGGYCSDCAAKECGANVESIVANYVRRL